MRISRFSSLIAVVLVAACTQDVDRITTDELVEAGLLVVGFDTPESVLHDPDADLYLVTNINGSPFEHDGNGYVSRLSIDGRVLARRWIDGTEEGVTLNAPKGMAISGDTLFISDIDVVRLFSRLDGAPLGTWTVEGASFLNDLAVYDGTVYVTDTGVDEQFADDGNSAVYRFDAEGQAERVDIGEYVPGLNGVAVDASGVSVVSYGAGLVIHVDTAGTRSQRETSGSQLDGLVLTDDGTMLISDWETGTVFRLGAEGNPTVVLDQLSAPADIGFDAERRRLLIPLFTQNQVIIQQLGD